MSGTRHVPARLGRRRLLRIIAGGAFGLVAFPATARATAGGCRPVVSAPPTPVADARLATALPEPFSFAAWAIDPRAILADAARVVSAQLAAIHAPACFSEKAAALVERVDLLSPFEFLVTTVYDSDHAVRDVLLELYARDPGQALRRVSPVYPTPRSDMVLATLAYYDVTSDRVRVNLGKVNEARAPRILVHEFWHALPLTRVWKEDGATLRASGFWVQRLDAGGKVWLPLDHYTELPFPSYLLAEGMATTMEARFAGQLPRPRPDIDAAQRFLDRVVEVADPAEVMRLYLESRPAEFAALVEAHRADLPEYFPLAHR